MGHTHVRPLQPRFLSLFHLFLPLWHCISPLSRHHSSHSAALAVPQTVLVVIPHFSCPLLQTPTSLSQSVYVREKVCGAAVIIVHHPDPLDAHTLDSLAAVIVT